MTTPTLDSSAAASTPLPAAGAAPILDVRNVSKTYHLGDHDLTVLDDVTFSLQTGATGAIIGPSGSGKTTLLGLCAGLDRPSVGSIALYGAELATLDEDARAQLRNEHVGFVFQNFQLLPTLTALENVLVPRELRGEGGREAVKAARELLGQVGLGERMDHYPAQLSGGEQQRVSIARAFAHRPQIVFADEPTGNLDADTGHAIIELLFNFNREAGTTLLLVTHDPELASRAQKLYRFSRGKVTTER